MLNRRHLLRASGLALALPWLEAFDPPTSPAARPGRLFCFCVPSGVNMWRWHPEMTGPDYKPSNSLQSLEPFRKELSIFSGLEHDKGAFGGHGEVGPWLTGGRNYKAAEGTNSISIDQHVAATLGTRTRIPSLVLSAPGGSVTVSFDAKGKYINAENNLRRLFSELCGSPDVLARLDRRESVLDLVGDQAKSLTGQLGRHDRDRFDDYLQSVREVERRIAGDRGYFTSQPLATPASGLALDADPIQRRDDYVRTMLDLVALALRNDQCRFITFTSCESGAFFYGNWPDFGSGDHHSNNHLCKTSTEEASPKPWAYLAAHDRWWVGHLSRFLGLLQQTPDGDGSLLSRTMVLYGGGMSWTHNGSNLPMLLAGGSKLGLKHGSHHRFNPHKDRFGLPIKDVKPDQTTISDLLRTISERLGVPAPGFGDSSKVIGELLT